MAAIIGSGLELYIKRNARDQALNRRAEAEKRAELILDRVEERVAIMERDIQAGTRTRIAQQKRRLLAQADLNAKQIILSQREQVIEEVWQSVEQALRQPMATDERLAHLMNALTDAATQLGGGNLELYANADDMALITDERLSQWRADLANLGVTDLTLSAQPADIWGGLIVWLHEKRQMVDNSWNERLALARRELRDLVYARLTNEPDPRG